MSDKKFNLKTYQKIDGDEHIDMRLEEARGNIPDVINEKQLEPYRAGENDVLTEKLLETKRIGEETEITEKRLDTHKPKFANKYRNPSAHEGDMNKLEEQRLQGDPVEKEKYEAASEAPRQFRWWEGVKSPDGLKLAKDQKKNIIAKKPKKNEVEFEDPEEKVEELTFDKPRWQEAEESPEEKVEKDPVALSDVPQDFDVIEEKMGGAAREIFVKKEKYLPNSNPELSGIYMLLTFDPDAFGGSEEEIKQAALDKVLTVKPELSGLISVDNFGEIQEGIDEGTVNLRAWGPEFAPIVEKKPLNIVPSAPSRRTKMELSEEEAPIEEMSYEEKNIEGTPMAIGRIMVNSPATSENREDIVKDIVNFIQSKHPHLDIEQDSLDLSDIERGDVRYMVGVMGEEVSQLSANSDFEIIVESALKKN